MISGAIRDDGTINWECPCIQREVVGPCGVEFRTAFSAYVDMKNEGQSKPSDNFMSAIKRFMLVQGNFLNIICLAARMRMIMMMMISMGMIILTFQSLKMKELTWMQKPVQTEQQIALKNLDVSPSVDYMVIQ